MANLAGRLGMKLMTVAVGIPVGIAVKKAVGQSWALARPGTPPSRPDETDVRWGDAIAWGALSAAGVVAADLLTRRGAEALWRVVIGTEPPPPKKTRAEKNLETAQDKVVTAT